MIFQHTWQQVLDGTKTQTRRIVNGETFIEDASLNIKSVFCNRRKKWKVGDFYAVQQGRGKPAIAYIKITAIRRERIQDITEQDALAENPFFRMSMHLNRVDAYRALWDSIHTKTGERWADNPLVWVIEFELVKTVNEDFSQDEN